MLIKGDQVVDQEEEKHETERLAGSHGGAQYGQVGLLDVAKYQAWMVNTALVRPSHRHIDKTLLSNTGLVL